MATQTKTHETNKNGKMAANLQPQSQIEHTFTEAPASINLRFDYQGYNGVILTLRAESGLEVLTKLDGALAKLEKMGATPANRRNGASGAPTQASGDHVCPTHGTKMLLSKHRANELYCPEKIADTGGGPDGSKPIYCKAKIKL